MTFKTVKLASVGVCIHQGCEGNRIVGSHGTSSRFWAGEPHSHTCDECGRVGTVNFNNDTKVIWVDPKVIGSPFLASAASSLLNESGVCPDPTTPSYSVPDSITQAWLDMARNKGLFKDPDFSKFYDGNDAKIGAVKPPVKKFRYQPVAGTCTCGGCFVIHDLVEKDQPLAFSCDSCGLGGTLDSPAEGEIRRVGFRRVEVK